MAMTTTDDLMTKLTRGLKPVKRQHLAPKLVLWLGIGLLFEVVALTVVGLRADLAARLLDPVFTLARKCDEPVIRSH